MKNIYFITPNFDMPHLIIGCGETEQGLVNGRLSMGDHSKARAMLAAISPDGNGDYRVVGFFKDFDGRDHDIHYFLKNLPFSKKHMEVFAFRGNHSYTEDIIVDMCCKEFPSLVGKNSHGRVKFTPRPYQTEFIKKANKQYSEFLLWAKCRAGKSVMVLSHILDRKFKVSLIVSRSTSPEQSWKEDPTKFSDFENIRYICLSDKKWEDKFEYWSQVEDIQIIFWSTIQGLVNIIEDIPQVDFLCYDECHLGYGAKQWKEVRSTMKDVPCMYVSGTAFKLAPDFSEQNTFIYTYFDEQLDVQRGVFHRGKMNVVLAKYDSEEYRKIYGDCPDAMKNIFAVENDKFVHEGLVIDFVHNYLSTQRHIRNPKDRLLNETRHAYLLMPSAAACDLIAEYIKDYSPFVATGKADVDADLIKKHVAENTKTMIITRWANVLGVTIEEIDTVINCSEGQSTEFWIQSASRGGSGDHDYNVIEFSPQKCLESIRLSYSIACDSNSELLNYESTEFVAIHEWNNQFAQMTQDQINQITACDIADTRSLIASAVYHIDMEKLNQFEMNLNFKSSTSDLVKSAEINDNGANGKTNVKVEGKFPAAQLKELSRKKESIKSILEAIPLTILYEMRNGKNANCVENVLKSDYYVSSTGDDQCVIERCLQDNLLDYNRLLYRISQASVDIAIAMKNSFAETLDTLSVSSKEHRCIPYDMLSEMIDDYVQPHHKILVICDPSGSHVAYLIEKCGVAPQNIWVWESCQTHLFRVQCVNSEINMVTDLENLMSKVQFDGVISNPPYSINSHKTGKSSYGDFAEIAYNLLKEGGYGIMVHPPGLRKPTNKRHYLMRDVQVEKLSIHSSKEGLKVFNAATPYDWYSYRKAERTGPTKVRFQDTEEWVNVDFRDYPFVPNHSLNLLEKYLNTDASIPRLNPIIGRAPRFKDKKNSNKFDPTVYFDGCYVNVNKTTLNGEPEFVYDKKPQSYYQQKKVIFKEGGNFYPYYDDGKYGVSDNCMYIVVNSKEEGESIVEYLNSKEANQYRDACQLSGGFRTVCDMLKVIPNPHYVKKG
jgi:hypothetical protein